MIQFNKKQMAPLIEKYQINVETNRLFEHILELFEGQQNYQVWGVKVIFSQVMKIGALEKLAEWVKVNKSYIGSLKKQNIVAYTSKVDMKLLSKEMLGIEMRVKANSFISSFNTEQKKMLKNYLQFDSLTPEQVACNTTFKNFCSLIDKVEKISDWRKAKLFSNASNVHGDVFVLLDRIENVVEEAYVWDKEDCINYIQSNFPKCEIIFNEGPYLIVQIDSYISSQAICGHDRTKWCITNQEHMWDSYTSPRDGRQRRQYFYFDFSKDESDEIAHVGFTVEDGTGVVEAQSTENHCLRGDGMIYGSSTVNIDAIFNKCGVKKGSFLNLTKKRYFDWSMEGVLSLNLNKDIEVIGQKDGRVFLKITGERGEELVFNHTCIDYRSFSFYDGGEVYAIINLAVSDKDDDAILGINYSNDVWGSKAIKVFKDMYGSDMMNTSYLADNNIRMSDFIDFPKISDNVMLHKLICEEREDEAIELYMTSENLNPNFEFNGDRPVFVAIEHKMWKLFDKMFTDPRCDISTTNPISGSILTTLLFLYLADEFGSNGGNESVDDLETIKKMIVNTINSGRVDLNLENEVNDSALSIAAEFPQLSWALECLLAHREVDVNKVNHFDMDAFNIAMSEKNEEGMRLLGLRPDLVISRAVKNVAKENGIDYKKYINPSPYFFEDKETDKSEAFVSIFKS